MKKIISIAVCAALLLSLAACGSGATSEELLKARYDEGYRAGYDEGLKAGKEEGYKTGSEEGYKSGNEAGYKVGYQEGLDEGKSSAGPGKVTARFSGEFTATVEKLIPDYVVLPGNAMAVVNFFQDGPFLLNFREDMTGKLIEGKPYVFTFQPFEVEVTTSMTVDFKDYADTAYITGYREASENEIGLASKVPTVEITADGDGQPEG